VAIFPKLYSVYMTVLSYKQYMRYCVKSLYWFTVCMDDIYAILEVSSMTIPRKGILPRIVCQKTQTNRESKFSGLLFFVSTNINVRWFFGIINSLTVLNHINRTFLYTSFFYSYVIRTKCALLVQRNIFSVSWKQLWTKIWRMVCVTFTG
jgi:hypothetical protein